MTEGKRKRNATFQMAAGAFLTVFSSPCIVAAIHDVLTGASNLNGALMMGVFFVLTLILGLFLGRMGWQNMSEARPKHGVSQEQEAAALRHIQEQGGVTTVAQLAMHTNLTVATATGFLNHLLVEGVVQSWITDEGAIAYKLPGVGPSRDDVVFDLAEGLDEYGVTAEQLAEHEQKS